MKTISILFVSVVMIFISSCTQAEKTQDEEFEYKTIQLYPKGQETLLGEATISVPILNQHLKNDKYSKEYFGNRYLDIEYYWGKTLLADASLALKNSKENFKPFLMKENYSIVANTDEFISILITSESDTAFLNMQKNGATFSKKTGKIISLDDILKNKDYKELIKGLIKDTINNDTSNLYSSNAQRSVDLVFDNVRYYLTETELIFLFPANSIVASDDSIPLAISLNDLDKKVGLNK